MKTISLDLQMYVITLQQLADAWTCGQMGLGGMTTVGDRMEHLLRKLSK